MGCLIYELTALMPPFLAANQKLLAMKIKDGHYRPIPAHYSQDLEQIIKRMLTVVVRLIYFTHFLTLSFSGLFSVFSVDLFLSRAFKKKLNLQFIDYRWMRVFFFFTHSITFVIFSPSFLLCRNQRDQPSKIF